MVPVAGVDGCKGGWVVVTESEAFVCPNFEAALAALPDDSVIAVDMPIGLLDEYVEGGREPDRAARGLLGKKWPAVFSAPPRRAFGATGLSEAQARGCRMTIQALKLMPKIEEVDRVMTPTLQQRVREVHPEVCFRSIKGGPVVSNKKRPPGRGERRRLLEAVGLAIPPRPRPYRQVAEDDLLDACVAMWSAHRIAAGRVEQVQEHPPSDSRGLRMEIVW
jgi:threonine dehydratase